MKLIQVLYELKLVPQLPNEADGRTGIMPGFGERLDDTQIKALTAWLAATP